MNPAYRPPTPTPPPHCLRHKHIVVGQISGSVFPHLPGPADFLTLCCCPSQACSLQPLQCRQAGQAGLNAAFYHICRAGGLANAASQEVEKTQGREKRKGPGNNVQLLKAYVPTNGQRDGFGQAPTSVPPPLSLCQQKYVPRAQRGLVVWDRSSTRRSWGKGMGQQVGDG